MIITRYTVITPYRDIDIVPIKISSVLIARNTIIRPTSEYVASAGYPFDLCQDASYASVAVPVPRSAYSV